MTKNTIIEKIKHLVKKTGHSIFGSKGAEDISADAAKQIQKDAYKYSRQIKKDSRTPVYLSIANQLIVEDEQIFKGAIYTLANIAKNEKNNANDIINILEAQTLFPDYIKQKIEEIKKHHNIET